MSVETKSLNIICKIIYTLVTNGCSVSNVSSRASKIKQIAPILAEYGGILAKIAQIMTIEDGYGTHYSDLRPYALTKTINQFEIDFKGNKIDFNVFKAGSVGIIFKGVLKNNDEIVFKVKYIDIEEQFKADLKILKMISKYLFSGFVEQTFIIEEISKKLFEELDFIKEKNNQLFVLEKWILNQSVIIPQIVEELCTDNVIVSEFIEAEELFSFISNSSQEQKNNIGNLIIQFVFDNIFIHHILYSDIHYGNFLVQNKNKLVVVDFGILIFLNKSIVILLKNLLKHITNNEKKLFLDTCFELGILHNEVSIKSKDYLFKYLSLQLEPFYIQNFTFSEDWLEKAVKKNELLCSEWNLPIELIFFNKINYGLFHILTKLKTTINSMYFHL